MEYGYIRVSSREQNEERQVLALRAYGVAPRCMFTDRQSGADFDRPAYRRLLARLAQDDLMVVKSIDRLGRNYAEITEQWRHITREKRADIVVLDMPLLDTRRDRDLLGTFLSDIVLQILSFVAENERENIRARQAEGIAAAKARGVRFGRPNLTLPPEFEEVACLFRSGQITLAEGARRLGISSSTLWRRCQGEGERTLSHRSGAMITNPKSSQYPKGQG